MQPAILQCAEVGMFLTPFYFDSFLCPIFWAFFLLGALIQFLLLKKARRRITRRAFVLLLLLGLLICEAACQVITGWDLLLPMVLYFYLLTMLASAALCALIFRLRQKHS